MKEIMTVTFTMDEDPHIFGNWTNSSAGSKFNNLSTFLNEDDYQKNNVQSSITVQEYDLISVLCLTILLSFIILATIAGNVFVLIAILRERNLQTLSNYLVFSLAIADLMVACLVMPIGAQYEVMEEWILGSVMCEIWTSGDVLCCTASILHLVAIAVDRYCAVTNINYVQYRSTRRVGLMIATVWCVSFIVSFAPILGWKDQEFLLRVQKDKKCLVSQDIGYQIFATCATFYVPLIIILILYWRIYQVVRKRIRHRPGHAIRPAALLPLVCAENVPSMTALNGSSKMVRSQKINRIPYKCRKLRKMGSMQPFE
ncbi:UNVERIFIED_CONTAM: 5-hydroxytryptamine receptor 2B [Trichonephila clavipes]